MTTDTRSHEYKRTAFKRGTRFLKCRHKHFGNSPDEPVRFSREPLAKQLASKLAHELGITVEEMRAAAKFAQALNRIVANYGQAAKEILLGSPVSVKNIETISRTAPTRQQYEVEQIAQGKPPHLKPKSGTPVLDTENFTEVFSRLARARGLVQRTLAQVCNLSSSVHADASESRRCMQQLSDIVRTSATVRSLVDGYGVVPRKGEKKPTPPKSYAQPESLREACRGNGSALGLIEKNVRDIPRLPKSVKPTGEDVYRIRQELTAITKAAREERRLLKSLLRKAR
ncbi:MAG: hypothetical protein H6822_19720 [Planctomycetaceae bacterium]|nr:hypothetical protein [Planctomycetales bacterium]MCB9924417.1 hypothetical protein [Planctomycetaceae bacterium]